MSANKRITMQDIARKAGVTAATVSMALRDHARISPETRERVRAVAERLGYRPDPLISALMSQRRGKQGDRSPGTLGVVSLWPAGPKNWKDDSFYAPYRAGLRERAVSLGYGVDVFPCDGSAASVRSLLRVLRARGIQGVVIAQAHESFTELPFSVEGFAAAYIGNGIRAPHLSRVDAALDYDFRLAWRRLREDGCRHIALLTWSLLTQKNEGAWMGAYLNAQRELPAKNRIPPLELEDMDDFAAIAAWINRHKPEVLLTERSGLFPRLRKKFPALRLVCLALADSDPYEGIRVGRRDIGAAAVDLVVAQLNRGERGIPSIPKRVLVEGIYAVAAGA